MKMWPNWYRPKGVRPAASDLIDYVARYFGIPRAQIIGDVRAKEVVIPRHIVMAILRTRGLSYPAIGRIMGGRDHSSVIHACKTLPDRVRRDGELMDAWQAARAYAQGGK
jgi:chromosomal replication initiator protein